MSFCAVTETAFVGAAVRATVGRAMIPRIMGKRTTYSFDKCFSFFDLHFLVSLYITEKIGKIVMKFEFLFSIYMKFV